MELKGKLEFLKEANIGDLVEVKYLGYKWFKKVEKSITGRIYQLNPHTVVIPTAGDVFTTNYDRAQSALQYINLGWVTDYTIKEAYGTIKRDELNSHTKLVKSVGESMKTKD